MSTPLNERDLIQLNAYLDGELDADEQAQLLRRLARDPELQAELRALRATKMLLGMAERVPVPRNFTLDPAVYGRPARKSFWERIGLASLPTWATAGAALVATLICVGVLVFNTDLFTGVGEVPVAMEAFDSAAEPQAEVPEAEALRAPAGEPDAAAELAAGEEPVEALEVAPAAAPIEEAAEAVEEEAAAAAQETARAAATPELGIGHGPAEMPPPSEALPTPPEEDIAGMAAAEAGEAEADMGEMEDGVADETMEEPVGPLLQMAEPEAETAEAEGAAAAGVEEAASAGDVRQPRTMLIVGLSAAIVAALLFGVWTALRVSRRR